MFWWMEEAVRLFLIIQSYKPCQPCLAQERKCTNSKWRTSWLLFFGGSFPIHVYIYIYILTYYWLATILFHAEVLTTQGRFLQNCFQCTKIQLSRPLPFCQAACFACFAVSAAFGSAGSAWWENMWRVVVGGGVYTHPPLDSSQVCHFFCLPKESFIFSLV